MFKKYFFGFICCFIMFFLCGCGSDSSSNNDKYECYERGRATFYTLEENGSLTTNNSRYERNSLTAAHRNLPYGTKIKVTDLNNGRTVFLTINDHRLPDGNYIIKLSEKAANELAASEEHEFSIDIIKWG